MSSVALKNMALLQQLDEEGISLEEYLEMLIEKKLLQQGVIQSKNAKDILAEL